MNGRLKYIAIKGTLISKGEQRMQSTIYRPYESVSIVDTDGDEVHFRLLTLPKRLDDKVDMSKTMTFYILRYWHKENFSGVCYAIEADGEKYYYPNEAIPMLKRLGLESGARGKMLSMMPGSAITVIGFLGGALTVGLALGTSLDLATSSAVGFGSAVLYILMPLFFRSKAAGLSEMKAGLKAAGFDLSGSGAKIAGGKY